MLKGIDVSSWQSNLDYDNLLKNGINFVIIRCGFSGDIDTRFEEHYNNAKKSGLLVGAFFYSYAEDINDGKRDAQECLEYLGNKKFDLPIFYDLEDNTVANLGKNAIDKIADDFCSIIKQAGYQAGVYANLNWFKNYVDPYKLIDNGNYIWLAQWNDNITAKFRVDLWQYTNNCDNMNIDGNYLVNENIIEKFKYEVGKNYVLQDNMNVRDSASIKARIKDFDELTEDGKNHAFNQKSAVLKRGTEVTCLGIIEDENNNIWLRIPSGYIAGMYNHIVYVI